MEGEMPVIRRGMAGALLILLGIVTGAGADTPMRLAQAPAATDTALAPEKLLGVAAWNRLVGNSITGKEDDETLVEYYAPDGTAKSMLGTEISTGKWALVGETICFQYTDDKEMECYRLEVMGNAVTFTDQEGTGTRYEILKGNPKGL